VTISRRCKTERQSCGDKPSDIHMASTKPSCSIYFLAKLSVRFCFCTSPPGCGGLCGGTGPPPPSNPFCLDLGFNGDNAPGLEGGPIIPASDNPTPGGPITFLLPRPPPTFLLPPNPGGPVCEGPGLVRSRSFARSSESGEESAPRFCLLAFSCLAWTDRKCWRSSCHLISSLPNFDRVEEMVATALYPTTDQKNDEQKLDTDRTMISVRYVRNRKN